MTHLIDKAAVVAKIESIVNETNYEPFTDEALGKRKACEDIKDFLDTLEVKEVDLKFLRHPSKVNNNLFKEIYFGKPYKTRDGRKALYCYKFTNNSHALIIEGDDEFWYVRDDGLVDDFDDSFMDSSYYTDKDIVSEW